MNELQSIIGPYRLSVSKDGVQTLNSENYNCSFDFKNGYMERWGNTKPSDDTPAVPEVVDVEVTTICEGVSTMITETDPVTGEKRVTDYYGPKKPCSFCSPAGTLVKIPGVNGDCEVPIETLTAGDEIKTFSLKGNTKFTTNTIQEVYQREYQGDLIEIELSSGRVLSLTPNHSVMTKRGWVEAGDLVESDELLGEHDPEYLCRECGSMVKHKDSYKRYWCCESCYRASHQETRCPICNNLFDPPRKGSVFCQECSSKMNDIDRYYDHPLYQTYSAMIHRCYNPSRNVFESYGGRGICVEDRWLSFSNFIDDMGPTAESGLTVDRIDNDGNYGPGNCKWSTLREQRVNRRRFEGSTLKHKCISPHGDKHKVTVRVDGESHYLGLFSTEELAIEARDAFYNKVDQ